MAEAPNCPECQLPTLLPISALEGDRIYPSDDGQPARVFCPACGESFHGTDAQAWAARKAHAAFELSEFRQQKRATESAKDRELRRKLEAVKAGRWK